MTCWCDGLDYYTCFRCIDYKNWALIPLDARLKIICLSRLLDNLSLFNLQESDWWALSQELDEIGYGIQNLSGIALEMGEI